MHVHSSEIELARRACMHLFACIVETVETATSPSWHGHCWSYAVRCCRFWWQASEIGEADFFGCSRVAAAAWPIEGAVSQSAFSCFGDATS
jgi:hypothetical protein